jgi:hypothetical protein
MKNCLWVVGWPHILVTLVIEQFVGIFAWHIYGKIVFSLTLTDNCHCRVVCAHPRLNLFFPASFGFLSAFCPFTNVVSPHPFSILALSAQECIIFVFEYLCILDDKKDL